MRRYRCNNGELPPYEPFAPEGGPGEGIVVTGEKQTRMFRLSALRSALKLELLGMRATRGVSAYAIIKREFGLRGNKKKVLDQFLKIREDILAGRKPLPGWPEEPGAWFGGKGKSRKAPKPRGMKFSEIPRGVRQSIEAQARAAGEDIRKLHTYLWHKKGRNQWIGELAPGARQNRRPRRNPQQRLNDREREQWVRNDEGLYNWWKSTRLSMREFLRKVRPELDKSILEAINSPATNKTWRDYCNNPRRRRNPLSRKEAARIAAMGEQAHRQSMTAGRHGGGQYAEGFHEGRADMAEAVVSGFKKKPWGLNTGRR